MTGELITSNDDELRVATVRKASQKLLSRPLNFLYPLECWNVSEKLIEYDLSVTTEITMTQVSRRVNMNLLRDAQLTKLRSKQGEN